jgi:hypothetical protein
MLGLHVVAVILATQAVAFFIDPTFNTSKRERLIPYFPIEISRTAASLPYAANVFKLGVASLAIHLPLFDSTDAQDSLYPIWLGLVIVALFDDATYWGAHMLGVLIMAMGFIPLLFERDRLILFCSAVLIYGIRIILKGIVVACLEFDVSVTQLPWILPSVFRKSLEIMQRGSSHSFVTDVFRVCGVLQWVSFYLLYRVIR